MTLDSYLLEILSQEGQLLLVVDGCQFRSEPGADPTGLGPGGAVFKELVLGILEAHPLVA